MIGVLRVRRRRRQGGVPLRRSGTPPSRAGCGRAPPVRDAGVAASDGGRSIKGGLLLAAFADLLYRSFAAAR